MDDYHIKAQLIGELREAVLIKEMNLNLFKNLTEILEALRDYERCRNELNHKRVDDLMAKAFSTICELGKQSPEFQQWLIETRRFNRTLENKTTCNICKILIVSSQLSIENIGGPP
jgi:hypothetical protein